MIASLSKPYEDYHYHLNNDEVHGYSQSLSKHHQNQYSRIGTPAPQKPLQNQRRCEEYFVGYPSYPYSNGSGSAHSNFHHPLPHHFVPHNHPQHHHAMGMHQHQQQQQQQDYYFEQPLGNGAGAHPYSPMPYEAQVPNEYPGFGGYLNPSHSASQTSHTSSLSSPSLEHPAPGTCSNLAGSLPSPYSKDHPDMLAAMRNRTHSWSARSSRKSRAFSYDGKYSMPYEPQMGPNYSTPGSTSGGPSGESDQLLSPLVGSIDENFAADDASCERMRADSNPPYYDGVAGAAAGAASYLPNGPPSTHQSPHLERNPSYGSSNNSDNECYSPSTPLNNLCEFEDRKSKKSAICPVCSKVLKRDLTRHMRTHEETARFICPFPRSQCPHKRGQFNRPYDYKKHLLHHHFRFDKAKMVRRFRDLQSKLSCLGSCPCGQGNFTAAEWLDNHVLGGQICPLVEAHNQMQASDT